jgi:hypothetical protein
MKMDTSELLIVLLGLLPLSLSQGRLGPGPTRSGLGPPFDQFWGVTTLGALAVVSGPRLVRAFRDTDHESIVR